MWGWLLSLVRRDDRCLFHYWDGVKQRSIDPVVAHRGLWRDKICNFADDGPLSCNPKDQNGNPVFPIEAVIEAEDRVRDLGRRVFGVKAYGDGQPGLTCMELDELMSRFVVFSAELKKKLAPLPTSSEPTESTEPSALLATESSLAGPPPASSFMPTASSDVAPTGP